MSTSQKCWSWPSAPDLTFMLEGVRFSEHYTRLATSNTCWFLFMRSTVALILWRHHCSCSPSCEGRTDWWMVIGEILILLSFKPKDGSVILTLGWSFRGRSPSSWNLTPSADLVPTHMNILLHTLRQQSTWFVNVSGLSASDICWTLWCPSMPQSNMFYF